MDLINLITEKEGSVYRYSKRVGILAGRNAQALRNQIYNLKNISKPHEKTIQFHALHLNVEPKVIRNCFKIARAQKLFNELAHITPEGEIIWGKPYEE